MSKILHISDLHLPFVHKDYLKFCKKIYKKHKCNKVVFAGDIFEHNAISYHEVDPDGLSAGDELRLAAKSVKPWYRAFPKATVTRGNHDLLPYRKALTYGLPNAMLKSMNDIYDTPNWTWVDEIILDGVLFLHGKGYGKNAALNTAILERMPIAQGHSHSFAGVQYTASKKDRIFGLNSGCGIDIDAYCFAYGKKFSSRPILGCGVVLDGLPIFEPMHLGGE